MYSIYFAKSDRNHKVYVGVTGKDPNQRVIDHNSGSNKFTRHNGPFKLIYYETYFCKKDAIHRENFYKSGFGKKIKKLIVQNLISGDRSSVG